MPIETASCRDVVASRDGRPVDLRPRPLLLSTKDDLISFELPKLGIETLWLRPLDNAKGSLG